MQSDTNGISKFYFGVVLAWIASAVCGPVGIGIVTVLIVVVGSVRYAFRNRLPR